MPRPALAAAALCLSCGLLPAAGDPAAEIAAAPLAARSTPDGPTLFTTLPAVDTGIRVFNHFADPRMWGSLHTEIMNGAMGTGIAVADFDNDSRPDVFIVSKSGSSRLFRNLGNWRFADVTVAAGLAPAGDEKLIDRPDWTQSGTWADVNNDGWLDLLVCRWNAPNRLFINHGDGTFTEEAAARGLAISDACGSGSFLDYDRDGDLDLYIHTNVLDSAGAPDGQPDYLFRNRGDGHFEDVTVAAGISGRSFAHAVAIWDFDDDNWPDIYVANDFAAPDRLYRNNRDGTFTDVITAVVPHMPYSSMGTDAGDIDGNGWPDLFVTDMAATTHEKDHRGMAYSRLLKTDFIDPAADPSPQVSRNALYLNEGVGPTREAAHLLGIAATDWTWSVRFEDLDNDGRLDLHVTNGMIREYQNADLIDRMMLARSPAERIQIMRDSPVLADPNLAYRNTGDLRFEPVGAAWGLDRAGVSFGAGFGDFDGDGDLDLIVSNYEAEPSVLRNDSTSGHRVLFALRGTQSNRYGIGARVTIETASGRQTRRLTPSRGLLSCSEPVVHFGLGAADRLTRVTIDWPSGHQQTFTDLAVDQRYTVHEPETSIPPAPTAPPPAGLFAEVGAHHGLHLTVAERNETEDQPLIPVSFGTLGPALAVGDLNGDHRMELILGGTSGSPAQLFFKSQRFAVAGNLEPSVADDGPLLLLDYDGDGLTDLLQTKAGANLPRNSSRFQPILYRNTGAGLVPQADILPPVPISVGAAVAADFDRDGRLDVFLGGRVLPDHYPLPAASALLRNTGGRFADATATLAPMLAEIGLVRSALATDVDADGWPDLLLALEWGTVTYLHNDAGRGFTDRSTEAGFAAAGSGWWTTLASADFNGDGQLDYVAGNNGLNTFYQPPAEIYTGRFGRGRNLQVIEAYTEDETLYPRRTRRELGAEIATVLRRFRRNDTYARTSLPELLGAEALAEAHRAVATEFRSGVFLSQPNRTFRFVPLPRIAQIAPLQGLATGDFNGDGHADLYAVQNAFAINPGLGRFDGGISQLFNGDGHGNFTAVPPIDSGLVVPGDAKALVQLDLDDDGWPDFLVSRNSRASLAFQHRGQTGSRSVQVMLESGAPGRPVVGARVTLELANGARQVVEIQAGGGYYSQNAPTAFLAWPEDNPPARLSVRWPDGAESVETSFPQAPRWTVRQP